MLEWFKLIWGIASRFLPPYGRKHLLLVLDDNATDVLLLHDHLCRSKVRCDVASTGHEALAMMAAKHYSIVLTDMRMPHMSGKSFVTAAEDRFPDVHICVVMGLVADLQNLSPGRYRSYIEKPVTASAIHALLRKTRP